MTPSLPDSPRRRQSAFPASLRRLSRLVAAILLMRMSTAAAQTDPKASADEHFRKGVAAFKERRFGDAAPEFEEAYRLSPAYAVLFNIGQVNAALGRSVEAVDAYERFLKQGASAIPPDRAREVRAEIAKQQDRIGTVVIRTVPQGADIRMDGHLVGATPLAQPIRATVGKHTFDAILTGYGPQVAEVNVVGRSEQSLNLTLQAEALPAAASSVAPPAPTPAAPPTVTVIEVPRNEQPAAKAPDSGTVPVKPSAGVNWQRVIGYTVTAVGLGAATVGGLVAYDGWNKTNDARQRLAEAGTGPAYDAIKPDYDAAQHRNHVGWTVAGIGTAVLVAGIVVVATAPDRTATSNFSMTLAPLLASATHGFSLEGSF